MSEPVSPDAPADPAPAAGRGGAIAVALGILASRLIGFVRGEDVVDGKPAILDVPVGKGRVLLYAFNPLHRHLNLSDFRFVWNALLNWNDLP